MGHVARIAILAVILAGCQTAKGSFCDIASPIRLTAPTVVSLTDAEVKEILAHNKRGQNLCGWRP